MKLVITDRDGTINEDRDDYVKSVHEWAPIPGSLEALARLNQAGWQVVVATNQSGLGRGLFDMGALNAMHAKMNRALALQGGRVEAIFFCPHAPEDECTCRKPAPGLFLEIARRFDISLKGVPAVGNLPHDVLAAHAAGCEPHLLRTGKGARLSAQQIEELRQQVPGLTIHEDLSAFADYLLRREVEAQEAAA